MTHILWSYNNIVYTCTGLSLATVSFYFAAIDKDYNIESILYTYRSKIKKTVADDSPI